VFEGGSVLKRVNQWFWRQWEPEVGGVYSVVDQHGIAIVKVLAAQPGVVHLRLYKERLQSRPEQIATADLTIGSIDDEDGIFGMGHLPLDASTFESWRPELIHVEGVAEAELEGYQVWKEANGGVWE
jgi:hypothetical protein